MMHRSIHSQKFLEKRRKKRLNILFFFTLCLLTVFVSFILFLRTSFLQITSITVENSSVMSPAAISAVALSSLTGSYFNLIPHSSAFFYSRSALKKTLTENFKGIKDIDIDRTGLTSLRLSLVERTPSAVVCSGFRDDSVEENCYWSDDKGYIFAKASGTSELNHYYVPTDQGEVAPGGNFVSESVFTELQKFLSGASKGGLLPLGVLVGESGEYEMYIKNKTGESEVTVYFDDHAPFEKTLENLLTFWKNPDDAKKATTTVGFNYINLRFGNTVYYSTQ